MTDSADIAAAADSDPSNARVCERRLPAVEGFWVFVLIDMSFFGLLFLSFVQERSKDPAAFDRAQQTLDVGLGLTNMVVLLTSSWLVALAVAAARAARPPVTSGLLTLASCCGLLFAIIKLIEYRLHFTAGDAHVSGEFLTFYYAMTGLHFLHVVIGVVVLAVLARKSRSGRYSAGNIKQLETGATYWHMVDLLWVLIFPVLYLAA